MGRKKALERVAPSAEHDQKLLQAVRQAIAGLSEAGQEATPTAIEERIKANQYDVWSSITTVSALKDAIEAVKREPGASSGNGSPAKAAPSLVHPPVSPRNVPAAPAATKETSGVSRKKKTEEDQPTPATAPAESVAASADQESPAAPVRKAVRRTKQESVPANPPAVSKPRPAAAPEYDPTRSELLRVLEIARQESSVGKLRKMVQTVKDLADRVGGLDRLAICLDTLEEFGIK